MSPIGERIRSMRAQVTERREQRRVRRTERAARRLEARAHARRHRTTDEGSKGPIGGGGS